MFKSVVKVCGSTVKLQLILDILSAVEAGGIREGYSSVGRAPALQAGCPGFESPCLHQFRERDPKPGL